MNETSLPAATLVTVARGWTCAAAGALGGGLVLGVLTNLAQGWLHTPWDQIPNSGAVWSAVAFVAGALLARWASPHVVAVTGLLAEVGLVVGYYGYAEFGRGGMGDFAYPLVWLTLACVAGPLLGVAGSWWRRGHTARRRVIGLASLAGVFGMEGIHYAWVLHYTTQAWTCLAVVLLVSLLMARNRKERALALSAAAAFSLVAYAAIQLPLLYFSA
ncbi:DUF6518 family protein [Streptomyces sp. NPDC088400]|uniref:DUF6518 family protein n=1 Tax=Streptomyces sp. NPDC088400 TaxID=3365861 RepID=UPI0038033C2A